LGATFANDIKNNPMTASPFIKINDFFDTYAHALEQFDTKHMASHYHIPCTFLSDEASTIFTEASKLEGLFNQGTAFYKQFGFAHSRPEVLSKRFWTEKIAKVKVNWRYFDKDNHPIYSCDYMYILRPDKAGDWKIEISVAINEKERMEEWLQRRKAAGK
jgi:hypothetical protein